MIGNILKNGHALKYNIAFQAKYGFYQSIEPGVCSAVFRG